MKIIKTTCQEMSAHGTNTNTIAVIFKSLVYYTTHTRDQDVGIINMIKHLLTIADHVTCGQSECR